MTPMAKMPPPTPTVRAESESSTPQRIPKKYSVVYFERRIVELRNKLTDGLQLDTLWSEKLDPHDLFTSTINALVNARATLSQAQTSLSSAQAALKKHQNDDTPGSDDIKETLQQLTDDAQKVVDGALATVESTKDAIANVGKSIISTDIDVDVKVDKCCCRSSSQSCNLPSLLMTFERTLLECTILVQATPTRLAAWCNVDDEANADRCKELLLDRFLSDLKLMRAFLGSGGPSMGLYGPAIDIYFQIMIDPDGGVKGDPNNTTGDKIVTIDDDLKHRLALAVALELAKPIEVYKSGEQVKSETQYVDPVQRFYHYLDAYELGQLDPAFDKLSAWELRYVVDSNACHSDLMWGRQYLQAYRPDQIYWNDDQWRYLEAVRTDIGYRHPDHEFHNYVDLLSAGGVCGARAWFGRFICKCFGMPTWGVRQPGHAAISRYRPSTKSWQICMGAAWKFSTWDDTRYLGDDKTDKGVTRSGPDFLEEATARTKGSTSTSSIARTMSATPEEIKIASPSPCPCSVDRYYHNVVLLECLAESLGETVSDDLIDQSKKWRSLSLAVRRKLSKEEDTNGRGNRNSIIDDRPYLESECCDVPTGIINMIGYDNNLSNGSGMIVNSDDGTIVIPAASFVLPTQPSKNVLVMDSYPPDGNSGSQLHLEQDGSVEYVLPKSLFPKGSSFKLYCRIVNVHRVDTNTPLLVDIINPSESKQKRRGKDADFDDDSHDHENDFVVVKSRSSSSSSSRTTHQSSYELPLSYTKGMWDFTQKISITIGCMDDDDEADDDAGNDYHLKLSRNTPCWGLTIKDLWFTPT